MSINARIELCGARMSCDTKRSVSSRWRSAWRMLEMSVSVATVPANWPSAVWMGAREDQVASRAIAHFQVGAPGRGFAFLSAQCVGQALARVII